MLKKDYPLTRIETIYNLKPEYREGYEWVLVNQDKTTKEIVVTLWSKWGTSYNVVKRYPARELTEACNRITAETPARASAGDCLPALMMAGKSALHRCTRTP